MGFFASGSGKGAGKDATPSLDLIHRLECKICPLNKIKGNVHPHMAPSGASDPLIYILGEAPGRAEDDSGKHFVGDAGRMLRARIPQELIPFIRWNNVIRDYPPRGRAPEKIEIEACRPSIERDIAKTKPRAIFGFGPAPLHWALGQTGINKWRGHRVPVEIGGHRCWYYAFEHPLLLLRQRRRNGDISENERAFRFDLQRAFDEIEELPDPVVLGRADAEAGLEIIPCTKAGLTRLAELLAWAKLQPVVGVDYETKKLRPYDEEAQILSAAVGTAKLSFAFAFDHPGAKWTPTQRERVQELWDDFIRAPNVRKAVHNLAFELEWSAVFFGADVLRASLWDDTYTQVALLDERALADGNDRRIGGGSLDFVVQNHFGFNLKQLSPLNRKDLSAEPLEDVLRYNAMDAKFHCMVYLVNRGLLEAQGLQQVYLENLRRIPTLVLTQIKGVPVDQKQVRILQVKYAERIDRLEAEIAALPEVQGFVKSLRKPYNPMSNADVIKMFRDIQGRKEGYIKGKVRENGFVSTHPSDADYAVDKLVLEQIGTPLAKMTIELREAHKRKSTYIDSYATGSPFVWPDGLLHPTINPQGAKSGRTSAEDPNVQNMPKRNQEAKEVRKQIKASKGHLVVSVDYGQIQPRGIAMMSRDKVLVKSMWDRYDIHMEWAERIAREYPKRIGGKQNLTDKKTMKEFRQVIKAWDLQLFFGAILETSSDQIGVPVEVMRPIYNSFWKTFSGVADWHEDLLTEYHKAGKVRHMDGRYNRSPLSRNQLFNYPIQGVETEIVLDAMSILSERATDTGDLYYQANMEIHDDLTFILPAKGVDQYVETIVKDMLSVKRPYINVPLTCEIAIGEDLLAMEEVLVASSDEPQWRTE